MPNRPQLASPLFGALYSLDSRAHFLDRAIFRRFVADAEQHASDQWSFTTGTLNNLVVGFTFGLVGDGCLAWSDWIMDWFNTLSASERGDILSVDFASIGSRALAHHFVRVRFRDGSAVIVDPWRDRERPFWSEAEYEREFGTIHEGKTTLAQW